MASEIQFTHAQYMNGECSHNDYYAQFVTLALIYLVSTAVGKRIIASTDEHFNDIPLSIWVNLSNRVSDWQRMARANDGRASLSDMVCLLKAAARCYKNSAKLIVDYPPL